MIEIKWDLIRGLQVCISMERCRCLVRSLWVICIIIRLLWHTIKFVGQDEIKFDSQEEFDVQFVQKFLESIVWLLGVTSCGLVKAHDIAFSINLPVFSWACSACLCDFIMSPDTLSVKFLNTYVIILNCCKITVDWSCGCTLLFWGELIYVIVSWSWTTVNRLCLVIVNMFILSLWEY